MKKLYEEDDIQAIADKIREKNGSSAKYKVSDMAEAVGAIETSDYIEHADIPAYVKNAVLDVVKKVQAVRVASSIVFAAISDPHHATNESSGWRANIEAGNLDACRAMKAFSYIMPMDFAVFLGDLTFGYKTTTKAQFIAQCEEFHGWIDEGLRGVPQFWTPGNHDTGEYLAAETGNISDLYGTDVIKKYFSDYNQGAVYGNADKGYCYRDFNSKKIRVINLNTVESEITAGEGALSALSDAQLLWFAQTLYSLNEKTDAASWGFIVLGHYSLDWGYVKAAGKILNAYLNGTSITVSGTSFNYSGKNKAICYGNFHGHIHNFKSEKLYVVPDNVSVSNPPTTQMNALRIGHPCSCFYRTNEVGTNNRLDSNQIEFGETETYSKTAEGANDTAFCVNVINPSEKRIYSFCYGAGFDRTLSFDFAAVMHNINVSLTHCSIDNPATIIEDGASFSATLTADSGYILEVVSVYMAGTNITPGAYNYSDKTISINKVVGDVQIVVSAVQKPVSYYNCVNDAIGSNGASLKYQDGYSLSSSGAASQYGSQYTLTGFIPLADNNVKHIYRIGGEGIGFSKSEEYNRIAWYDSNFEMLKLVPAKRIDSSVYFPSSIEESTTAMTIKVVDDSGKVVSNVPTSAAYFRVAANGKGENLIVTLDEDIT